jgi:hypothetical protein
MTQVNIDNIKAVYQLASSQEIVNGKAWYSTANAIAEQLAESYNVRKSCAIGVIAALSPRNKWSRNVADAEAIINAYIDGGSDQAALTKVCTFGANKAKAIKILELDSESAGNGVHFDEVLAILSGPKLREFASCIHGLDDVCIDGHAWCIHQGGRVSLKDVPAIGVKLRREIKNDYRQAAADLGVTGYEVQAVTWVAWRRIHGVG